MKKSIKSFVFLAIALIMLSVTIVPQHSVAAGGNGQKLAITTLKMSAVIVEGYNPSGKYVTWRGYTGWNNTITTEGWWWVGRVKVTYKVGADWITSWKGTCYVDVPRRQNHDYSYVRCGV